MLPRPCPPLFRLLPLVTAFLLLRLGSARAEPPRFDGIEVRTNGAIALRLSTETGARYRLETSPDLTAWSGLVTFAGANPFTHVDTTTPPVSSRYYRTVQLTDTNALTGDHLGTSAGDLVVHPVNHASLLFQWNGRTVYVDPVGGTAQYRTFARADLVLVTHAHSDHFEATTIQAISTTNAPILAPAAVYASLSTALKARAIPLSNGMSTNLLDLSVEAVPAYNSNHPRGTGNGYVVGVGGRRLFFSGDTGDIPEMRALRNIDLAFVCMNTPFTMTVPQAAAVVRAFAPRVVYPYHYRNQDGTYSDLNAFARQVGADPGIEVRSRKWY